jgi:hypothetical protein
MSDPYPDPSPTAIVDAEALQRASPGEKQASHARRRHYRRHYRYSASFEHDRTPQETVTGELEARTPQRAAWRAVTALKQAYPRRSPRSLVVVLEWLDPPRS